MSPDLPAAGLHQQIDVHQPANTVMQDFAHLFETVTGNPPFPWQAKLAADHPCGNRLIRIPTGLGKTLGVLSTWLYHRIARGSEEWPRRLVWCLPMRTLVEQTAAEARKIATPFGVPVHCLMGGVENREWHLAPEANAILIGTQDMLLSRALNRGYASPRARWPMEFALLNCDCLWVLDEVQLMDVSLATSAQLQQFREDRRAVTPRPSFSWWMSATLQPGWLKSVDTAAFVGEIERNVLGVADTDRQGPLWATGSKPLAIKDPMDERMLAEHAVQCHESSATSGGRTTLVIVNTVTRAKAVFDHLRKIKELKADHRLVHSRFRPHERRRWHAEFLNREACVGADRIVVATQVVEAGVDISATCLITDLAPWSSLVQRFGRAARHGGSAPVHVVGITDEKQAAPYALLELDAARSALQSLRDVSLRSLEEFHAALTIEERSALYPYAPPFLLLRHELEELFDTTPDLTGADLDISRFIRSGEERDCQVFWSRWEGDAPPSTLHPSPDALCGVPFSDVRTWISNKRDGGRQRLRAFVWDYLDDCWRRADHDAVLPGRIILVQADDGGYDRQAGFTGQPPKKGAAIEVVPAAEPPRDARSDSGQDNDALSMANAYRTIADHGRDVAMLVQTLASGLGLHPELAGVLEQAALWHDLGKAHQRFRDRIAPDMEWQRPDLAKAPDKAWALPCPRDGFRHELASALALFEVLALHAPEHASLRGAVAELLDAWGAKPPPTDSRPTPFGETLAALRPEDFDLLVYLVGSHHGKVRAALHACPADQAAVNDARAAMPIRGVREGDALPGFDVALPDGTVTTLPPLQLHLDAAQLGLSVRYGRSWRERTLALQERLGPFGLALLEAVLRAADIRVSRGDPLSATPTAVSSEEV